jgi:CspA family cold shock protein
MFRPGRWSTRRWKSGSYLELAAPLCLASRRGAVARRDLPCGRRIRSLKTGTVKWFNPTKGYGFIQPDGGGADAFVHISAVERAGYDSLSEGQRVQYELVQGRNGKSSAENLKIVG